MTNTVIYMRVSGDTQIKGDGFPRQRLACEKYAAANSLQIVKEFVDEGVTGKMELENREGLSACIHYVRENGISLVLVEDSTRLARDLIVAEVCIREFQKAGVRVVAASGGIDLTEGNDANPTAKLVRQILAAVSEFERCVITLKLKAAKLRKRDPDSSTYDPNYREGKKPYGMLPGEAAILTFMDMRRRSIPPTTFQQIAHELNYDKKFARSGKPWTVGAVHKILQRAWHGQKQQEPLP